MRLLSSLKPPTEVKAAGDPTITSRAYAMPAWRTGQPYRNDWDPERAVKEGMLRSTWLFRGIDARASAQAKLPLVVRKGDREKGDKIEDHFLLPLLNSYPNPFEDALSFRHRIGSLYILSKMGVFLEIQRRNNGDPMALFILPPTYTYPLPDPRTFVSGYQIRVPSTEIRTLSPADVIWFRKPHPTDPYSGITPLEAAGLAVDMDFYARLYNRNFMLNDGRPGGILSVDGELEDDVAEELEMRFSGPAGNGLNGAGRISVIEAESTNFIDTAISPRDAQYKDSRLANKQEILFALGTPESVLGNASARTFANADAERANFYETTVDDDCEALARALDRLDGDPTTFVAFDVSGVAALVAAKHEREKFHLEEYTANAITLNQYQEETGRKPFDDPSADTIYRSGTDIAVVNDVNPAPRTPPIPPVPGGAPVPDVATPEAQKKTAQ